MFEPTGRPAKSTPAIIGKLQRESVRHSRMQDVAGRRIITPGIAAQDVAVEKISGAFPRVKFYDRRENPSFGYRAVHVVVNVVGFLHEIRVRTDLQHRWAELSEKVSERFGTEIKYGGGSPRSRSALVRNSKLVARFEQAEAEFARQLIRGAESNWQVLRFRDADRLRAQRERLEIELRLNREGTEHEVVIGDAASERALRRTHGRYFETIERIARRRDPADE